MNRPVVWETIFVHLSELTPCFFELEIPTENFDLPSFLTHVQLILNFIRHEQNLDLKAIFVQAQCRHYLRDMYGPL
jgi:hypothetical protein